MLLQFIMIPITIRSCTFMKMSFMQKYSIVSVNFALPFDVIPQGSWLEIALFLPTLFLIDLAIIF